MEIKERKAFGEGERERENVNSESLLKTFGGKLSLGISRRLHLLSTTSLICYSSIAWEERSAFAKNIGI